MLEVLSQIASKYNVDLSKVDQEGGGEILFDGKHLVTISSNDDLISLKSSIIQLSSDQNLRLKQMKVALKTSLALLKTTLTALLLDANQPSESEKNEVILENTLCLFRLFEGDRVAAFKVVEEIEAFLAALEVYKKQIPTS